MCKSVFNSRNTSIFCSFHDEWREEMMNAYKPYLIYKNGLLWKIMQILYYVSLILRYIRLPLYFFQWNQSNRNGIWLWKQGTININVCPFRNGEICRINQLLTFLICIWKLSDLSRWKQWHQMKNLKQKDYQVISQIPDDHIINSSLLQFSFKKKKKKKF